MSTLFLKVVNMSISAGWLILAVLVLRLVLGRAPKWTVLLLWAIAGIRLVSPFTLESALSLIPSGEVLSPRIMLSPAPQADTGIPAWNGAVDPAIAPSFSPEPAPSASPLQILIPVCALIWLVGMGVILLYIAVSLWRLRCRVGTAVRLSGDVFQSEGVSTPFVLGFFRPRVYLPFALEKEDLPYVLAHERAHIRRHDHWWKPLGFLAVTLHWFNPLVWLGYGLFCRDMELACDERVIRSFGSERRADYAQALLSCSVRRPGGPVCPVAFAEVGIKARIRAVANYKKPGFWAAAAALVLCVLVCVCFLTDPRQEAPVLPEPTGESTPPSSPEAVMDSTQPAEDPSRAALQDLAWFLELAAPDASFREMEAGRRNALAKEYGGLLDDYALLARESEDGGPAYIIGFFTGKPEENPFRDVMYTDYGGPAGDLQFLYWEEDMEEVESALSQDRVPVSGYVIRQSLISCAPEEGLILIQPRDSLSGLFGVFRQYLTPMGRDYLSDAADRGIALMTPAMPYLRVHLISEQWGELSEDIPLTREQLDTILSQSAMSLDPGHGFAATLYGPEEVVYFTESTGAPALVLELATEKCGYKFASPADISGTATQARLDCGWLEEPLYASQEDLPRLTQLLQNAQFGYVGACGYGARLTLLLPDGRELVLFKGTDGCDTLVFGSWGGYFLGERENLEFWHIFGLDPDTKQPLE